MSDHLSRDAKSLFHKIFTYEAEARPTAESLYYDPWVSPPVSIKDRVASILGESKSTFASSMNKVSNNEESGSEVKQQPKQQRRIGNNFRLFRSPGKAIV